MKRSLTQAARELIARYLFELAPHFEGEANWRRIWAIERRFNLIGYADSLERAYRRRIAEDRVARCARRYAETMDGDAYAYLTDARRELAALKP